MIVYSATKQQFVDDVRANAIADFIEAQITSKDAIVKTGFQHGDKETNHPSYQAWSYAALIQDYNQTVRDEAIALLPSA